MNSTFQHSHRTRRFDLLLALGLTLLAWGQVFAANVASHSIGAADLATSDIMAGFHQRSIIVSLLFTLLCFAPLIWRRDRPLLVLGVVTAAQCATALWTHDPLLTFIAPLIALYTAGSLVSTRQLVIAATVVVIALVGTNFSAPVLKPSMVVTSTEIETKPDMSGIPGKPQGKPEFFERRDTTLGLSEGLALEFFNLSRGRTAVGMLQIIACLVAFAALGRMTRLHREFVAAAAARAEEEKRAREAEALQRAEEERLRIARELHDITAHSLMAVAVQAGAAEALVATDPEAAVRSIEQIREVAKKSLAELRSIVGVLREGGPAEDAPLVPEVSLAGLDALLQSFENSGLAVELTVDEQAGSLADLPLPVDIAAYRIVQESLTNVLRHARAVTKAAVVLELTQGSLSITVSDDGVEAVGVDGTEAAAVSDNACHGIEGMRERAVALGGRFEAGYIDNSGRFEAGRTGDGGFFEAASVLGSGFIVKAVLPR
jgi:signal transduction histidine kinase